MKNYFLDTNVVIDLLAGRQPFVAAASGLFDMAEQGKIKLYISALSYSNIYYIIKKTCSHREMISLLQDLEAITETLAVTKEIISKSLNSSFSDFEDSVQYYTALSGKNQMTIVTRNIKDFKKSTLPILTPEEALHLIKTMEN